MLIDVCVELKLIKVIGDALEGIISAQPAGRQNLVAVSLLVRRTRSRPPGLAAAVVAVVFYVAPLFQAILGS